MTSENQRCKVVALLKSLKNIYILIFRIHIPESIQMLDSFLMTSIKQPFYIFGFRLSCIASGYFYFYIQFIFRM